MVSLWKFQIFVLFCQKLGAKFHFFSFFRSTKQRKKFPRLLLIFIALKIRILINRQSVKHLLLYYFNLVNFFDSACFTIRFAR